MPLHKMTTDASAGKPRIALTIATAFGLGYMPKAPGTWGSLMGVLLGWAAMAWSAHVAASWLNFALAELLLIFFVSFIGVPAASRVTRHLHTHDPQIVVVDEVAGQLIAYMGLATPASFAVNWKYVLLGFILFRVFDIWKPFPAQQAESLPGGLGIMADDWIAGVYAALVLLLARHLGL